MSDSDSDGDHLGLMGFMFGNIDEHGKLENDVLDNKSKSQLDQLNNFAGFGELVGALTDEQEKISRGNLENLNSDDQGVHDEAITAAADAVDYFNITELADETIQQESRQDECDDYDDDENETSRMRSQQIGKRDSQEQTSEAKMKGGGSGAGASDIILPSIVSHSSHQRHSRGSSSDRKLSSDSENKNKPGDKGHGQKQALSKHDRKKRRKEKLKQQQQQMSKEEKILRQKLTEIEEKINGQDMSELFPEFRPNQVLRFLRLFAGKNASSLPNVWKNCRRRKKKRVRSSVTAGNEQNGGEERTVEQKWMRPWRAPSPPIPTPDQCLSDEELTMLKPMQAKKVTSKASLEGGSGKTSAIPEWRYGPAALWYDMLGVPESGEGFDYGFKLKPSVSPEKPCAKSSITGQPDFPDPDHFYMVSQVRWEDDIIWNAEDIRHKVGKNIQPAVDADEKYKLRVDRAAQAGWVPTSTQRTAMPPTPGCGQRGPVSISIDKTSSGLPKIGENKRSQGSIFPIDNYELIYGNWEKDIIWDDQNMESIPDPSVFRFDPNDENIILTIPDEPKTCASPPSKEGMKKDNSKKSKSFTGKSNNSKAGDGDDSTGKKDLWNLSNDEFYDSKNKANINSLALGLLSSVLQHSTPAMELQPMFFTTCMTQAKLQAFHRPHLRRYQHGAVTKSSPHQVHCVMKHLRKKAKQREQERAASGGGEVFFMRKPEDVSALDGHLILAEYSEEFPPLQSQVGMAVKIKNYHKRRPDKDSDPVRYRYGDTVFSHTSPFLGVLAPGQSLQAFECNMFRAPIYEHRSRCTDFLIIRTRHNFFIRHVPYIFTVGQQCPLIEVPGPNSKKATNHVRDFLQVFIYRMFAKSHDLPKKIRMEEVRKAFPNHSESSIRKRLKLCADFHRTGQDSNWWVIKKDFRLPTEEEMRAMVSPEQACAFYSMIAAEQRLKDAGYGDRTMLYAADDDNEEEHQHKVDEEVLNAPWNTTRAFISAIKGKCLLQVMGPADPTGCGEGFSYVKVPMKPQQTKTESAPAPPKKLVTGTDADLRRLSLSNAKQLLKKFGVPEEEIKKLSRWEVIDVVRTMSTEQARSGEGGMSKFARGTRFSVAEHQERYKEECQRLFDLQNKVLSLHDILSTDEDSSSADDSDFEEMGKNIENLLSNKKSANQITMEKEEQERKELLKMMSEDRSGERGVLRKKDDDCASVSSLASLAGRCLKIQRRFRNDDGTEFVRVETVRKPEVIDAYVRIRSSKNEEFIKKYMMMDEQHREEMRREKRRIQEQLRRIKRNQEKDKHNQDRERKREKDRKLSVSDMKLDSKGSQMKCGACGQMGHMRTNRFCPMYRTLSSIPDRPVALTEEQEQDMERRMLLDSTQNLVKVEGTKITLSKDLIKNAEAVRRKSLVLKFQKPDTPPTPAPQPPPPTSPIKTPSTPTAPPGANQAVKKKRRYQGSVTHCDYLMRIAKKKERRRADPVVTLSTLFENVLNGIRDLPETLPFHCPVNPRLVKDYYKIIEKPMDLQTMRENVRKHLYMSRADFHEHIELIVNNSRVYNGHDSQLTCTAARMLEYTDGQFRTMEDKLMRLEKAINPLLDDDDQVAFSFILDNILMQKMLTVPDSWPFHNPVNRKLVPDYYTVVARPMDLGTIRKNVQKHIYQNRGQFMEHVELILTNSVKFNGADSAFTETARKIVKICRETLDENDSHLTQLENDIAAAKKAAEAEAADIDDVGPSTPGTAGDDFYMDEDSNMSFNISDDKTTFVESDVDVETVGDGSSQQSNQNTMDARLLMAFEGATRSGVATDDDADQERGTGKSRLLEDLLMSDGELSGTEDSDEDEGDNPFAGSDSDGSDDAVLLTSSSRNVNHLRIKHSKQSMAAEDEPVYNSVTSYLDAALSQASRNLRKTADVSSSYSGEIMTSSSRASSDEDERCDDFTAVGDDGSEVSGDEK